ncbi:MAG: flagellar brake protein [Gammaproteobacteria bacterium]
MDTYPELIIHDKQQIIDHLTLLIKHKSLLTLSFADNGSFITKLLLIDLKNDRILLDYGPKEYLNRALLEAVFVRFSAEYTGIKVVFEGGEVDVVSYQKQKVFSVPFPTRLLWRQRRQFYRIKSPLSKASHLVISFDGESHVELILHDISISGFSVLLENGDLFDFIGIGQTFSDCRLILDKTAEDVVAFKVCNIVSLNPEKPDKVRKLGCKFTRIKPAFESSIQRYMQQIEREQKQKR